MGNEALLDPSARILKRPRPRDCAATDGATVVGWVMHPCWVCRKCLCNAHNAFCNRHGVVQPAVTGSLANVESDFYAAMRVVAANYHLEDMLNYDTWLRKWPESKQKQIRDSVVAGEPILTSLVSAMVKRECLSSDPTKARLIQFYYNLATQALFGPQFYALQKATTGVMRRFRIGTCDVTFGSGMNALALSVWMNECVESCARVFYERDGKCWDATMSQFHTDFRLKLYGLVDPELADFAAGCVNVTGTATVDNERFRYRVRNTVKSGHNDTTLGNSLINAAIAASAFTAFGVRCSIIVAGDDLLVACYDDFDFAVILDYESSMGIRPDARKLFSPEDVSFVSGVWAESAGRYWFVPKPGKLLAKLWWTVNPPGRRKLAAYQRGVARGLWPSNHAMPVVREFLRAFDGPGEALYSSRGYRFHGVRIDPKVGFGSWFCRRYGLAWREVCQCEGWLATLPADTLLLRHRVLGRIMEVDLADLQDRPTVEPPWLA